MHSWFERVLKTTLTLALGASLLGGSLHAENDEPFIYATEVSGEDVVVSVHVPSGYQSAVLEISNDVDAGWQPIVAGTMAGEEGLVRFRFPDDKPIRFMRVRAGHTAKLPNTTFSGGQHFEVEPGFYLFPEHEEAEVPPFGINPVWSLGQAKKIGHLLNRIAYGPHLDDVTQIESMGIEPYIKSQLRPNVPQWQKNPKLEEKEAELFYNYEPVKDKLHVEDGDTWRYLKGTTQPPRTCLLYTSPSPRDLSTSRMPSSA